MQSYPVCNVLANHRCCTFWLIAAAATLVLALPAIGTAGMVLHEKTELVGGPPIPGHAGTPDGTRVRESTTYLQGKKIRTETEGRVWILDFNKGLLISINPAKKTYTEMSLKDLKQAQQQAMEWMKSLRSQMEEKMATMPKESREAMRKKLESLPEGMFGEEKPAKITIKATGEKKKINGFPCTAYNVYEDGELTTVYWMTRAVSTQAFDAYQKELRDWLEGMGPMGANRLREWEHVRDKGFPIKVERVKPIMGKVAFNREILQVEEKSLSESLFMPPAGFKRTSAPTFPKRGAQPMERPSPEPQGAGR